MMRSLIKRGLRFLGKSDRRILAVYAASGSAYRDAVDYVRKGAPGIPIWLISTRAVDAEVARNCERVLELPGGPGLPFRVARALWPHWVALNVVTFTREPRFTWLKASAFAGIPGKVLVMNEHRDVFAGSPVGVVVHLARRLRDWISTSAVTTKDLALGIFWKLVWTLLDPLLKLTSQPWLRVAEEAALEGIRGEPILFRGDGASLPADVAPLKALFDRPDTFAAGFQCGRSGFQKDITPRAAFRQLQPGEATALMAPLSNLTLVDSAKLCALGGFPRTWSRRSGWLLLCWKAAQAGWKSYSVGIQQDRAPMIADRAFPEAEFCFRLLAERARSRTGSLDTRRGSISFHPRYRPRLREKTARILIVSPYLPFPLSHGGAVRIFNLARCLSSRYDLLLVSFREREDHVDYARLSSCFSRVIIVDHDERRKRDPASPRQVSEFRSRTMRAAIQEAAREFRPDLVQIEYTLLAECREALPDVPAVLVEHDVTFSLYEQLYRFARTRRARAEYERWHRYESFWLQRYDSVVVMSEEERSKAVGAGAPPERTHVVPNGVDTERFQPSFSPPQGPPELLYVGSFRHLPNLIGFEYLRQEILPRIWSRFPELRVRVVAGPDYGRFWREQTVDERIQIDGFVEDVAPYYARASAIVVPLKISAGTNIKVMEALSCGKPIISTPVGCAGLDLVDGQDVLISDETAGFVDAVIRVFENPELRRSLERQARRVAVERFSWQRAAGQAAQLYDSLVGWPPRAAAGPLAGFPRR